MRQENDRRKLDNQDSGDFSQISSQFYVISHLILFAILGTLARIGLRSLTTYTDKPVAFASIWPNFTGSFIMGFLCEDFMLFNYERRNSTYFQKFKELQQATRDDDLNPELISDMKLAKKSYDIMKKEIPLYTGLTTGFCGSFTSFSSFVRDAFLALINELPARRNIFHEGTSVPASSALNLPRKIFYSIMAAMAVIITTVSLCSSAWVLGSHVSRAIQPAMPSLELKSSRRYIDGIVVLIALISWIFLTILATRTPYWITGGELHSNSPIIFSLVLAPLGCLARFYISFILNSKKASFPIGTFSVNLVGTIIMGISYYLQLVSTKIVVECQVMQGIQDGFCGCLTTVSSWIAELFSLQRNHAYTYGFLTVISSLCSLVVVMGCFLWLKDFTYISSTPCGAINS